MRTQALQAPVGHRTRLISCQRVHRATPKLIPRLVSVAGSTGSTGDYSTQDTIQAQPWQQKVARTAVFGLTAAALGLALFQGRAKASGAAAGSVAPALMTQVRQAAAAPAAVASAAAVTPAMLGQNSAKEAVHYRIMQLFAAPIYGKVLAVFAVAAPILLLGSVLYHKAAEDTTWSEAFMKPYAVLLNCPGILQPASEHACGPAQPCLLPGPTAPAAGPTACTQALSSSAATATHAMFVFGSQLTCSTRRAHVCGSTTCCCTGHILSVLHTLSYSCAHALSIAQAAPWSLTVALQPTWCSMWCTLWAC